MCYFCQQLAECIKMLNDPAVRDPEASEDQLATVQSALDCVNDFVDNIDMVITNYKRIDKVFLSIHFSTNCGTI